MSVFFFSTDHAILCFSFPNNKGNKSNWNPHCQVWNLSTKSHHSGLGRCTLHLSSLISPTILNYLQFLECTTWFKSPSLCLCCSSSLKVPFPLIPSKDPRVFKKFNYKPPLQWHFLITSPHSIKWISSIKRTSSHVITSLREEQCLFYSCIFNIYNKARQSSNSLNWSTGSSNLQFPEPHSTPIPFSTFYFIPSTILKWWFLRF